MYHVNPDLVRVPYSVSLPLPPMVVPSDEQSFPPAQLGLASSHTTFLSFINCLQCWSCFQEYVVDFNQPCKACFGTTLHSLPDSESLFYSEL